MKKIILIGALLASMLLLSTKNIHALQVGIHGGTSSSSISVAAIQAWLGTQGHTVTAIDPTVFSDFTGLDVYLSIRDDTGDTDIATNVSSFVNNLGGGFVTEFQSTDYIMNLFGGTSLSPPFPPGVDTEVQINSVSHPVTTGITSFTSSGQTEFNWKTDITGTSLTLLGTIAGENAIMAGTIGSGRAVGLSFDWQDEPWNSSTGSGNADLNQLILNAIGWSANAAPVPEPATIALLGIGLLGLAGVGARRKWKKKTVDKS